MTLRWPGDFDGVHHVAEARNDRLGQSPEANSISKPSGRTDGQTTAAYTLPAKVATTRGAGLSPTLSARAPRGFLSPSAMKATAFSTASISLLSMRPMMPADRPNVLLPMRLPTQKELRAAVANIIRDLQRDRQEHDQDTADRLGISVGTVRNARNETTDLNALTIARIGAVYGASYLNPYNGLYGATATPVSKVSEDPLCSLAQAVSALCEARRPDGDGGHVETPKELLDMLPILRRSRASLDGFIATIEKLRLVA